MCNNCSMKIIIDANISSLDVFANLGQVITYLGHEITSEVVAEADVLLVRSQTSVNEQLLASSKVQFVGTATAGTNHIDLVYLKQRNIAFASAPGANAHAVVDYVIAAIMHLSKQTEQDWMDKTYGIVGMGYVGAELYARLSSLGLSVMVNDPPLENSSGSSAYQFSDLDTILAECDVVSVHSSLTHPHNSKHPSYHLLARDNLSLLKENAWLINAARGEIIEPRSLLAVLSHKPDVQVVLDVFANEPYLEPELVNKLALATPHIAGYTSDAKVQASQMLYKSLCAYLQLTPPTKSKLDTPDTIDGNTDLAQLVKCAYDIAQDDKQLRAIVNLTPSEQAAAFYSLRSNYRLRKSFYNYQISGVDKSTAHILASFGFQI
jgi:erythronate-4-phosphate dehydrogenase